MVYNSNNYYNYTERIRILQSSGDDLLQKIQCLETNLNKKKKQNHEPIDNDIIQLQCLVTKSLQLLAEINVCQFFHQINEYYNANDYYYKQMCRKYFEDLMQQFNLKLKEKRINHIKHYDDDIDFSIG